MRNLYQSTCKSPPCRMLRLLHPGALCRFSLTSSAIFGAKGLAILPPTSLPATPLSLPLSSFTVSTPNTPSKCSLPYHHPASTNMAVTATVIFPSNRPLFTSPLCRHGHDEDKVSSVRFMAVTVSHGDLFSGSWNHPDHLHSQRWHRGGCLGQGG